jgi:hypothetical protein
MMSNTNVAALAAGKEWIPPNLTEQQLAARWQMSVKTLQANRWKNLGCPYFKAGRLVRYRMEDVVAYEAAHLVKSMGGH